MAMLAEPRRKQKWSVDPRNNTWSNDESRFGQKMLEKMGWSKGKGLGAREQGSTENIKVQVKNNTVGLGAAKNYEDNWIAHQDEFNKLLSELNDCHGQNDSPVTEGKTTFSLEEKSKSSKKRVHYQKFTKGKDLSSRSSTDLACIFGKRSKRVRGPREQEKQEKNDACLVPVDDPKAASATEEINTVTSSITVQEYFANRMAQLKKSKTGHEINRSSAVQELEGDDLNSFEEVKSKSKKKKKRCRGDADRICNFNQLSLPTKQVKGEGDGELNSGLIEDSPVMENYQTKRNSRKSRAKPSLSLNQNICPLGEVESEEVQVEQYSAVNESSEKQNEQDWDENKKKRKKTKKKATTTGEDEVSQSCHSIERRRKKKEKK
ncbi:PIN2/TERF1-interacting telomerase inhibitor 1 [Scyliorhinus canicula]|uniref:PIN2/TERF1-interacting telomerase inhibitor 1 n=1 Tax=Scyliorhinus canicula TaxID=7830 RepID=UPI0018F7704A|nr:PIN2/TERF1-interacting telomerase inhibitor 1 [Scyliorhinus canicula]